MSRPGSSPWKRSRYVTSIEVKEVDKLLLFAGLVGRLVEVPGSYRRSAYHLLDEPNLVETSQHITLHKLFREQGVIVPAAFDELDYFKQQHEQVKYVASRMLGLTICPTLNCNFQCSYCYQHHPVGLMTQEIQDRIVSYVEDHYPPLDKLFVTWFGGEPLLGLAVIESLTERFLALPIDYDCYIITNGSQLSGKVSQRLVDLRVNGVQITLDGPREVHNARRPLVGGRASYDKILANIAEAHPGLAITIRVNVDQRNVDEVLSLFDQLDAAGLRGRVTVYFAPVAPYTEVCADVSSHCMTGQSWARLQSQLRLHALERGYGATNLPQARHHVCLADHASDLVIVPSGLVFKCWNDVTNPSQAIYDLSTFERTSDMEENLSQWLTWGPFNFPDCERCTVLPLCMGGCPHVSIKRGRGACNELKDNLKETILLHYLNHKRGQAASQLKETLHRWMPMVNAFVPE